MFYPKKLTHTNRLPDSKARMVYNKKTKNGTTTIIQMNNILTQQHKDILDVILAKTKRLNDKKFVATITKYEILKQLGYDNPKNRYAWLNKKLKEIRQTFHEVEFRQSNGQRFIATVQTFTDIVHDDEKYLFIFDARYIHLFYTLQQSVDYKPLLADIIQIKDSVIKAVVRYCLMHKYKKSDLFEILKEVGYEVEDKKGRMARNIKKIFADNQKTLNRFNIKYDRKRNFITYNRKPLEDNGLIRVFKMSEKAMINENKEETWKYVFKPKN